ncbi:unnamed protein product [Spirodela intermedia]|uniref:Uncharacterized protein n=1 Tax=Spirodela intermedia TaxID=51605 RepID=A0A7I8LM41_SPIIN|nr:unnamed protein product [Spirodela intermedia]
MPSLKLLRTLRCLVLLMSIWALQRWPLPSPVWEVGTSTSSTGSSRKRYGVKPVLYWRRPSPPVSSSSSAARTTPTAMPARDVESSKRKVPSSPNPLHNR